MQPELGDDSQRPQSDTDSAGSRYKSQIPRCRRPLAKGGSTQSGGATECSRIGTKLYTPDSAVL